MSNIELDGPPLGWKRALYGTIHLDYELFDWLMHTRDDNPYSIHVSLDEGLECHLSNKAVAVSTLEAEHNRTERNAADGGTIISVWDVKDHNTDICRAISYITYGFGLGRNEDSQTYTIIKQFDHREYNHIIGSRVPYGDPINDKP
jgi:hypothetical protein